MSSTAFKGLVLHKGAKVWSGKKSTTVWDNDSSNPFNAYTDNSYKVFVPLRQDLSHLRGLVEHECAHVRFTHNMAWERAIHKLAALAHTSVDSAKDMLNLLEDLRVEAAFNRVFLGAHFDFSYLLYALEKRLDQDPDLVNQRLERKIFRTVRFNESTHKLAAKVRDLILLEPTFVRVFQGALKLLLACPSFGTKQISHEFASICRNRSAKKDMDQIEKVVRGITIEVREPSDDDSGAKGAAKTIADLDEALDKIAAEALSRLGKDLDKIEKELGKHGKYSLTSKDRFSFNLFKVRRSFKSEKPILVTIRDIPPGDSLVQVNVQKQLAKLGLVEVFFRGDEDYEASKSGTIRISKAVTRAAGGKGRFFRRKRKVQGADVLLLVDQSGSMQLCKKSFYGIVATAAFQKIVEASPTVNTAIIGFSARSGGMSVYHRLYKEFNEPFSLPKLCSLRGSSGNRDGTSIRYATQYLESFGKMDNKKVLLVISDGWPAHDGTAYYGKDAVEDTRKAINEARSMGVHVLGLAIGITDDHKDQYRLMYGTDVAFMDPDQLTSTVVQVARLVQMLLETA